MKSQIERDSSFLQVASCFFKPEKIEGNSISGTFSDHKFYLIIEEKWSKKCQGKTRVSFLTMNHKKSGKEIYRFENGQEILRGKNKDIPEFLRMLSMVID